MHWTDCVRLNMYLFQKSIKIDRCWKKWDRNSTTRDTPVAYNTSIQYKYIGLSIITDRPAAAGGLL